MKKTVIKFNMMTISQLINKRAAYNFAYDSANQDHDGSECYDNEMDNAINCINAINMILGSRVN